MNARWVECKKCAMKRKNVSSYFINPYFIKAPLVAGLFSKLLPYSLINKGIREDG